MNIDLRDKNILVTGACGFLGLHLLDCLSESATYAPPSHCVDLLNRDEVSDLFNEDGPFDYCFHLAGYNGNIEFNLAYPGEIFFDNTMMALNVLEACRNFGVKKVVSLVASCAYPSQEWEDGWGYVDKEVLNEDDFLKGEPHQSVAAHAYAKRNLQLASHFYRQQYGLNAVCACPTTLFGPGDSFDLARTKVLGALVKRFVDAVDDKQGKVTCWGSGKAMREFLYVEDAAKLLVETMLHYDDSNIPLNLGTGQEYTIKQLAGMVASAVGFSGEIVWNTDMPDGQMRKRLDTTRMNKILPSMSFTPIEEGIAKTVADYRSLKQWKST